MSSNVTVDALLSARYGRRTVRPSRRRPLVALAVFAMVVLSWAGWVGYSQATAPVSWQDSRFAVLDDGHAAVTFQLSLRPGRTAVCTLRVRNSGLTEVGRTDTVVGPSAQRTFSVTATVPTFEQGASGSVLGCAAR